MRYGRGMAASGTMLLAATLILGACSEAPTAPHGLTAMSAPSMQRGQEHGTGLVLNSLTGVQLPLIGKVGDVNIDQANITHLVLVQDVVGNIVGLQADGVLTLTGGVLGTDVISEDFLSEVHLVSSGSGQCDVVTVDLGPMTIDALGAGVSVDVPQADVTPKASGALGPLLCNLGQALQPAVGGVTSAVRGLVNAINSILI